MDQTAMRLDFVDDFLARCTTARLHSQQLPEWTGVTDPDPKAFARRFALRGTPLLLCQNFGTVAH